MLKRLLILSLLLGGLALPLARAAEPPITTAPVPATTVNGIITVNVDHGVPLTLSTPATSVFIANPNVADVQVMSPTTIMIFGKTTGETTFMATDANGTTLAQRTIVVTQDLTSLRQELASAIPGSKIHVDSVPNGLVLTGEAKDPATIADAYKMAMRYIPTGGDIINRVQISGSNQVMIRVRFAEVERSIDEQLGFNWSNMASVGGFTFGIATGITDMVTGGGILSNRPNNADLSTPNDVIGVSGSHGNVNGVLDALAQDGLVTILAEPNLTAMSGETANFLAGGEFPIPVPQGNNQISIQFKDYGISLEFTPTIISGNRISIHVKPEVSELTTIGAVTIDEIAVPGLLTRKAETTVEVASGQSFAIAGLLDNSQAQTVNKFPLLGDLPVLGPLFRDSQFQNGQTELIIVITPYVVTPSHEQLALPTDGMSPPSESDRLLGMRYNSSDPTTRTQSGDPVGRLVAPPSASAIIPVPVVPESSLTPSSVPNTQAPGHMVIPTPPASIPTPSASLDAVPAPAPVPAVSHAAMVVPPPPPAPDVQAAAPATPALDVSPVATTALPASSSIPPALVSPPMASPAPDMSSAAAIVPPANPNPPHPAPMRESHENPSSLMPAGPGGFVLE